MKKVLRSLCWLQPTEKTAATDNYKTVKQDRLLNLRTAEKEFLEFCLDFYQRNAEAPQLGAVLDFFETGKNADAVVMTEEINLLQMYSGGSFKDLFEGEVELQASQELTNVCKTAVKIATSGHKVGNIQLQGVNPAVEYLFSAVKEKPPADDDRVAPSMKASQAAMKALLEERKNNPHQTYGIPFGYGMYDLATAGRRKKQLYLHAGFGGHLKSTHMMNMIVNSALAGYNPLLFTSEMPAAEVKLMMAAIHSANPKFAQDGRPLNAYRLILGSITQDESDFYDLVYDDLINNPDHGEIRVIDSGEFTTFGSIKQRAIREHAELEVDDLWIDYLTRLPVDPQYRNMEIRAARNETIADAKRFAMAFNKGAGIPVNSPFQINRAGYLHACANEGRVNKTGLADYNAAEKEADIITYIFYDKEETLTSEPKIGLLKSRWGAQTYDPVSVYIEPDSRRIVDMSAGMNAQTGYAPTASTGVGSDQVEL